MWSFPLPDGELREAIRIEPLLHSRPATRLSLTRVNDHWKVVDGKGRQVGWMARKWSVPAGMTVAKAVVGGIFTRWAKDVSDEEWKQRLRCDTWEIVVPRLTLTHLRCRQEGRSSNAFGSKLSLKQPRSSSAVGPFGEAVLLRRLPYRSPPTPLMCREARTGWWSVWRKPRSVVSTRLIVTLGETRNPSTMVT